MHFPPQRILTPETPIFNNQVKKTFTFDTRSRAKGLPTWLTDYKFQMILLEEHGFIVLLGDPFRPKISIIHTKIILAEMYFKYIP